MIWLGTQNKINKTYEKLQHFKQYQTAFLLLSNNQNLAFAKKNFNSNYMKHCGFKKYCQQKTLPKKSFCYFNFMSN